MTSDIANISHLENSSEFLCGFTDTEFRFLHTNRLFQKQFEFENKSWKGKPFTELVRTLQMEKLMHANDECINNPGKTISIEIQTITSGSENWFRWEISAVVNDQKEVEGVRLLGTDITKQKKAEQALLQQAILLDNISDAIISADEKFNIKSWNLKAEMMFNLRHDRSIATTIHSIATINFVNDSEDNFRRCVQENDYWSGDVLIEKKDGSQFYMQTMVNAIKDKIGKISGFVAVSRDVTKEHEIKIKFDAEQKKSRIKLIKEQKQFKTFMEHAPALAWINDEDGALHYMNTLFKNSFKLDEDALGKNIFDYYPPEMKDACFKSDMDVLNKNSGIETFEEGVDKDGGKICYQVYKFPVGFNDDKKIIGGLALNVTEQVNDKMGIIKERNQFQSFMENAPLLAWITDADGILHYMNSRFKSSFNYTDDHLNKKIGSIKNLTDREKCLLPSSDVIEKNKSIEFFLEWVDENKNIHYHRTFKFPIQDVDGNYLEGGQSIEITAEIMAQADLKKSNELFEYAAKATRDVIWDWDIKENKIKRSSGYENLFGYEMNDQYETHKYEKIHKDDVEQVMKTVEDAFQNKESRWQLEYRYLCKDGSYKTVIDQAYILRNKIGKPIRVIGSMQDVTEERNLQEQVLITEKQKKKDMVNAVIGAQEKERNELSAELHDNVNQLLAASVLYLKTAQKQKVIEEKMVRQSLEYVEKAINEIRSISHNLTPSELKMNGLSSALKVFAEKLHIPKNFEVKLILEGLKENTIEQSLKIAVYRIVQELINNILKHAGASEVIIKLRQQDNYIKLTVTDNGKGFDQAAIKKGLGITNIYNRAENFGGTGEIISAPGKGCAWHINIPLN